MKHRSWIKMMLFVMVLFVSLDTARSDQPNYRLLDYGEMERVVGGLSVGGSGGKGGGGTTTPALTNIKLSQVPYVNQIVKYPIGISTPGRDIYYCGIASAIMVRGTKRI